MKINNPRKKKEREKNIHTHTQNPTLFKLQSQIHEFTHKSSKTKAIID